MKTMNEILRASDLMIGDWVKWEYVSYPAVVVNNGYKKVDAIYGDESLDLIDEDTLYEHVPIDEVKVVELTVEILEKNGFEELMSESERVAAMFGRKVEHTGVWMYCIPDTFDSVSYVPERKLLRLKVMEGGITDLHNLQYVHELQHFLRLFGIKKEIEL